ncbi:MAG: AmmeMemoRadiSam system protein B, partial [Candidatus Thermofonsia Clade 3 bacterium]
PYGVLPTELSLVDALAEALGPDRAFAGELYHRCEHSLELVLVWLHHIRQGRSVPVVPILVGSFQPFLEHNPAPMPAAMPPLQTLLERLATLANGRRTLVVASGDLAHIGPAFGGEPVGLIERAELHTHDEALLGLLAAGDAEGFWRFIHAEQDRYNVCGVAPFYLLLKHIGAAEGQRAGYAVCPADERNTS